MAKFLKLTGVALFSALLCVGGLTGCAGSKPSKEDESRLEEARAAAESAERKLAELRTERVKLSEELGEAGAQEQSEEQEQEELMQEDGAQ